MSSTITDEFLVVVFTLGEEEYGIEISGVQEIIRLPKVTKLPGNDDYILGIVNLRGKIISIVDLKQKLMLRTSEANDETRVIVVDLGDKSVGLVVDEVEEVMKIPTEMLVPAQNIGSSLQANYFRGVVRLDERLLILLDVNKIFA
jgi:purine-binding chemotaxis protein CheW